MTTPSEARLEANLGAVRAAARMLAGAKRVLISTGAGMSAESGIPTYRDDGGRWQKLEPFASRGIVPAEIAHPPGFRTQPALAWGFQEWLRRRVDANAPHAGYDVITRWVTQRFDAFVLTTNIDGYHLRAGVPSARLCERYGSQWELQCLEACRDLFWEARDVPLCDLDETTLQASRLPTCPFCGGLARPRIQMAFDEQFIAKQHDWARYETFRAVEPDVLVVIGTTLWFSWPDGVAQPNVISINPDPERHAVYDPARSLAVTMRAGEALVGIDWMLDQLL